MFSGLYYKHMTIVDDDSSIVIKWSSKLIDAATGVIYDRHMFIVQATDIYFRVCRHDVIHSISVRQKFRNLRGKTERQVGYQLHTHTHTHTQIYVCVFVFVHPLVCLSAYLFVSQCVLYMTTHTNKLIYVYVWVWSYTLINKELNWQVGTETGRKTNGLTKERESWWREPKSCLGRVFNYKLVCFAP
jgi:hypothetical protein